MKTHTIELLYPELSFQIIGFAFEVFNEIGSGHKESVYQNAMRKLFEKNKIKIQEQVYQTVIFQGEVIGKNYFDFIVDGKVLVELKRSDHFSKSQFDQVNNYLVVSGIQLGLLISFSSKGVKFSRVVNIKDNEPAPPGTPTLITQS